MKFVQSAYIRSMNILITGGTGFIGKALVLRLRRDGHSVTAYTRSAVKARSLLGTEASFLEPSGGPDALVAAVEAADAVVNLAGDPLLGDRWTERKKASIRDSRIGLTARIVDAIRSASSKPAVLVSASAVGIYGDGGDADLTESSPAGTGFLADVCKAWEQEAVLAQSCGVRVALLRTGVVLGREGGALDSMLPVFRAGLGGSVGSGRQFVPWIHLHDLVELICAAISDDRWTGPVNATGPKPVRFREFAKTLGAALHRPAFLPVPALAVRVLFGQAAVVLLEGQRAIPGRATELGFRFQFPTIQSALEDILDNTGVSIGPIDGPIPDSLYLEQRPPRFVLETRTEFSRPLSEIFSFFARPENLGLITPGAMQFRIARMPERISEGAEIDYTLRVGPVPLSWRTRIDVWEDGRRFVDSQLKGPYSSWWHEHAFQEKDGVTVMTDRVYYAPPLGPLGAVANGIFVSDELRRVFGYRASLMRLRFGGGD
ncbi:MAG: hypothetical protein ACI80V_003001 [Rhodothermales bacterium]|jgi:uncharacterized protein (TIGR01777 family)